MFEYQTYRFKFKHPYLTGCNPQHLHLELNRSCNMSCSYCYRKEKYWQDRFGSCLTMDLEECKHILQSARECGIVAVKFNWRGEPTLSPILYNAAKEAKKLGYYDIMLNTNGIKPIPHDALEYFTHISFSWHPPVMHPKYIQYYNDFCKNMFHALIYCSGKVTLQGIADHENKANMLRFFKGVKERAYSVTRKKLHIHVKPKESRGIIYANNDQAIPRKNYCKEPASAVTIGADGKVWACPYAYYEAPALFFGDINKDSLRDILNGDNRTMFMDNMKNGIIPYVCLTCPSKITKGAGC